MAELLKGAPVAAALDEKTREAVHLLKIRGVRPTLGILRVGERPDDTAYESAAVRRCEKLGIEVRRVSLPEDVKLMPYAQANYAHLCMLKQEYKKAYAIYTSIDPQQPMQENMTWEDMISNDFTELVKNDVEPELFIRMAHDLNRAGWHFE